jgi:hypothetical protein
VAGVTSAQVTVTLASRTLTPSGKPAISGFGRTTVAVNAAPPPPNAIGLTIYSVGAGTLSSDGSTVSLPAGTSSVVVIVLATLPDGGPGVSYTVSPATFDNSAWTANLQSPSDVPVGTPNSTAQLRYNVSVPPAASSTTMQISVTEDGKPSVQGRQSFNISVQ